LTATPEQNALRPGPVTAFKNLFLAGDWTATGLPATIEGSVRSGDRAADLVLARPKRPDRRRPGPVSNRAGREFRVCR